jgi:transcriptional regulator with XRE-family HTH domain
MTHAVDRHLGRVMRSRRKILGMTQVALAARVGVRFQQIGKFETAASAMSARRLWQVSQALAVPIADFFAGLEHAQADAEQAAAMRSTSL